jgi:hypothetical protein
VFIPTLALVAWGAFAWKQKKSAEAATGDPKTASHELSPPAVAADDVVLDVVNPMKVKAREAFEATPA